MKFYIACVLTLMHLALNAYVFDGTRSYGDQSKFPITNAVAFVEQKLAASGTVKAIYPLILMLLSSLCGCVANNNTLFCPLTIVSRINEKEVPVLVCFDANCNLRSGGNPENMI